MSGSTSPHDFVCEHDTVFRYSKGDSYTYNVITEEREEAVKQSKRVKVDGKICVLVMKRVILFMNYQQIKNKRRLENTIYCFY